MNEKEIAGKSGLSIRQWRAKKRSAKYERRQLQLTTIKSLQKDGLNNSEIGRKMGLNESTVRSLLYVEKEEKGDK